MCRYCEKGKKIEKRKKDNIYFKVWGKHLQVIGKVLSIPLGRDVIIEYCPMCRKEARRVIKEFCDICKVEIDNQNVLAIVSTPVKTYKVCKECLDDLIQHIQNKENNFKLESKRYERDYNKKWNEIC